MSENKSVESALPVAEVGNGIALDVCAVEAGTVESLWDCLCSECAGLRRDVEEMPQ